MPLCLLLPAEVENYDENLHENPVDQGAQKRYYFENLKISVPQIKLSVFTSSKLPLDLKVLILYFDNDAPRAHSAFFFFFCFI